ncbi:MAG TPA: lipopolysaccharide heptosyltransferase II [Planctomycetota bacterium]|nr:lipopolysaccharide heptosyltransferase II [Planctomycetota bacterium]
MPSAPPQRILVRLPNPIGDTVMSVPAWRALRAHWPAARIVAVGPPSAAALLEGLPCFDELRALPARRGPGGTAALRAEARRLRDEHFDLALLGANSFSSAWMVWRTGAARRVGYGGGGRELLLTDVVPSAPEAPFHRRPTPMVEFYFRLVERVGVPRGDHRTGLVVTPQDEAKAAAWLARHDLANGIPLYGIHGGASFGPSKLWYADRWAAVADELHRRHGGRTILFCGPGEEADVRAIAAAAKSPVASAADDPIDLRTLKAVMKRLALMVATDAGPRHVAVAFDVPCVALLGPTDPRFSNTNLQRSRLVRVDLPCSPCHEKSCPLSGEAFHRCMRDITPAMVLAECERLLAG